MRHSCTSLSPFRALLRGITMLVAASAVTLCLAASDPTGSWKFTAEANGRSMEATVTLAAGDGKLTGSLDNRLGPVDIKHGKIEGDALSFDVERQFGHGLRKRTVHVHYEGTIDGDTITGTIATKGRDKQPVSVPWVAHRTEAAAD